MAKQWMKEQMRKDRLAELMEKIIPWIQTNRENLFIGTLIFAGLVGLGVYTVRNKIQESHQANLVLSQAIETYYARRVPEALTQFDEAIGRNNKKVTQTALYFKAHILLNENRIDEAIQIFENLKNDYPKHSMMPNILLGLTYAYYNKKEWSKALDASIQLLINFPDTYLKPDALLMQIQCYKYLGEKEKALEKIKQIQNEYKGTSWQQKADKIEIEFGLN